MTHENEQDISNRRNVPKVFRRASPNFLDASGRGIDLGLVRLQIDAAAKGPGNSRASRRRGVSMARSHSATGRTIHYASN